GATDASTQLIQLRQTEGVGAVHEHRIGVGHVETRLDDHRRHQHVYISIDERAHDLLEIALPHLAVPNANASARRDAADVLRHSVDGLDAIVDEEDLPASIELTRDPLVDQSVVPRLDIGEHRRAIARRRLHQRHVAQTGEGEMERARNRSGSQRKYIGVEPKLLQSFLVFDTETMLLVNDNEPEL